MNGNYADKFIQKFTSGATEEKETTDSISTSTSTSTSIEQKIIEERVIQALKNIYDPELPVNIYDLGLIYEAKISPAGNAEVTMTLTTPGCPVAQTFPGMIECAIAKVEGVKNACVKLVWTPPWTKDRMSESAQFALGIL